MSAGDYSVKLYDFQRRILDETADRNRVAYYMDMGLGKTFVGAEKMYQLGAKLNLVICQKSKIQDWIDHFRTYYPDAAVFDLTKKRLFEAFVTGKEGVGIINYELAWRRPELLRLVGFTLMLDESSMVQNESAKRTKFIEKLVPMFVILLSGTPTSGKYENLLSQAHLLGWSIPKKAYWGTYIKTEHRDGIPVPLVVGYKNVDRLKRKFREYGAVFMKTEEVMDLPEQVHIVKEVPQSREYRKFVKDGYVVTDLGEMVADSVLTARINMRQLCGIYSKEKLQAFEDLVTSTDDRLIVFYNFNLEEDHLARICDRLERPVSVVSGQLKDLSAYEQDSNSVTLIQYQAGAMGLNLQKANKIIYYTLPERSELFEQSKKRIHRIGQSQTCFYYYLMVHNSIEQKVKAALDMRRDYTEELFNEDFYRNISSHRGD